MSIGTKEENSSTNFTCISCRVKFSDGEMQREHYKSEWHRYNLKRKEAELPAIALALFDEKKVQFNIQKELEVIETTVKTSTYCHPCGKLFKSVNSYATHVKSKVHIEKDAAFKENGVDKEDIAFTVKAKTPRNVKLDKETIDQHMTEIHETQVEQPMEVTEETNSTTHQIDEEDDLNDDDAIPSCSCLFCPEKSENFDDNMKHMYSAHGFFLPDTRFVSDAEGLITFLGYKVGCGKICILCNERSKRFETVEACQQHMVDKTHCMINQEGDNLVEYIEFYDYSPMFDENSEEFIDPDAPMIDMGYTMTLPSGNNVGHRSLLKFYKQKLKPCQDLVMVTNKNVTKFSFFKSLGYHGELGLAVNKATLRDTTFVRKLKTKWIIQCGIKGNKLFKSKGAQGQAY
uniref:C2H2-type domain-containing protein n=1 Tax=Rhabditophanes sp. KR3021 TaxID=114890 RepID=A0AC35TIL8_9BILA